MPERQNGNQLQFQGFYFVCSEPRSILITVTKYKHLPDTEQVEINVCAEFGSNQRCGDACVKTHEINPSQ